MRFTGLILATTAMILTATVASAQLTYAATASSDSGNPNDGLRIGDIVTVDITLRSDGTPIVGFAASGSGYGPVFAYQRGQAAEEVLYQSCFPPLGCFDGEGSLHAGALSVNQTPAGPEVEFVLVAALPEFDGTGELDPGVLTGVTGDPQFQIVFRAVQLGEVDVTFGSLSAFGDATILPDGSIGVTTNSVIHFAVIPEPGTALLMGLGLAGLAGSRRR